MVVALHREPHQRFHRRRHSMDGHENITSVNRHRYRRQPSFHRVSNLLPGVSKTQFSLIMRGIHATPDEHTQVDTDEDLEKQHAQRTAKGAQHEDATRVTAALNSNEEQDAYKAYYANKWGYADQLPKSNVQNGKTRDDIESNKFDQGQGKWTMDTMNFRGR